MMNSTLGNNQYCPALESAMAHEGFPTQLLESEHFSLQYLVTYVHQFAVLKRTACLLYLLIHSTRLYSLHPFS